jgi:hypothetical protein
MNLAGVTQVNKDTAAFLASHMASAQRFGLEIEGGLKAIADLLSPSGEASRALTLDGSTVGVAEALSASPAAAGLGNQPAANSRG